MAMLRGTLDPLVLKTVSWSPMHAFEITNWIEEQSSGRVQIDDAALLQSLHRLEDRRYITGEWGVTENGRRARYYQLTAAGRRQLQSKAASWTRYVEAVFRILQSTEGRASA